MPGPGSYYKFKTDELLQTLENMINFTGRKDIREMERG